MDWLVNVLVIFVAVVGGGALMVAFLHFVQPGWNDVWDEGRRE